MKLTAISNMTLDAYPVTMEQTGDDFCQHQNLQSLDWHVDVLQSREENRLAGKEQPMDWRDAKKAIRQRAQ